MMDSEHHLDSDISSIISTSSRPMASDTDDAPEADTFKYRLPEQGKTRAHPRSIPLPSNHIRTNTNGSVNWKGTNPMSPGGIAPTPPPKDEPQSAASTISNGGPTNSDSYFNPYGLSRSNSVYTLSRVSFTSQISQLTSIKLPNPDTLATNIAAIPSSAAAARVLNEAAEQIRRWIRKASEVLRGLDAEDDVEWAAAAGREGLEEVDAAIARFETLIVVYVEAIERAQLRPDSSILAPQDVEATVERMDSVLNDWEGVKKALSGVKNQVELAMEWEELWNKILGEIGAELEALDRMIFEMEERRHRAVFMDVLGEGVNKLDIKELETIVEEGPNKVNGGLGAKAHLSLGISPLDSPHAEESPEEREAKDDSKLLQLVARMQPLRAALDFLPMRLAPWLDKGGETFPSAVEDLERRRTQYEEKYEKLDKDAAALRDELGEDRWVMIFRNAGRSALAMCNSVSRTMTKLRDGLEEGEQYSNPSAMARKIQMYEEKKLHYSNGIESVLKIFEKGVNERTTVNGEILNLQKECQDRWLQLTAEMKAMDFVLSQKELSLTKASLRDSVSTILSADRSFTSSAIDTPGSSPASSVILLSRKSGDYSNLSANGTGTPSKPRQGSNASSGRAHLASSRRHSSLPVKAGSYGQSYISPYSQRAILGQRSISASMSDTSSPPLSARHSSAATPTPGHSRHFGSSSVNESSKPRWNASTNMNNTVVGHNFKPMSATTPSPHSKHYGLTNSGTPLTARPSSRTARSAIPLPSPLTSSTNRPPSSLGSAASTARALSRPRAGSSASVSSRPSSRLSVAAAQTAMAPKTPGTTGKLTAKRVRPSTADFDAAYEVDDTPSKPKPARPASMVASKRSSMLPTPRKTSGIFKEEEDSARKPWR